VSALLIGLLALAACTATISGRGSVGAGVPSGSGTSTSPSSFPSNPGPTEPPVHRSLVERLVDPPPGSVPWHKAWARNRTPTVRQFVAHVYPDPYVDTQVNLLKGQGIRRIAHETWYAPDADQADMILLQFDSVSGARSRYLAATYAKQLTPGIKKFVVPGSPRAVGYYHPELDKLGNVFAIVYARVGTVVVEEFYFSPAHIRTADAGAWIRGQLEALR
jgi:hypothetical protein